MDSAFGGMLILPATEDVIAGFMAEAEAAPDELSTIANVMSAPPMPFLPTDVHGKLIVFAMLVYAGGTEAGEQAVAPFRKLTTPLDKLYENVNAAAAKLNTVLVRIEKAEGPAGALIGDKEMKEDLMAAVAELRALVKDMKENPKKYFSVRVF